MKFHIGTCGYYYESWINSFYPNNRVDFLNYYSKYFNCVEINASFYRTFSMDFYKKLIDRVPAGFKFFIKVNQNISHVRAGYYKEEIREFNRSLKHLMRSDNYGGVIIQFPFSFKYSQDNMKYLEKIINFLPMRKAIEFRNNSWNSDFVINFLNEKQAGIVNVDIPLLNELFPPLDISTSNFIYYRLHGRLTDKWWNYKEPHERYDYLYGDDELIEMKKRVQNSIECSPNAEDIYVFFNNHYQAKAIKNALQFAKLFDLFKEPPLMQDKLF